MPKYKVKENNTVTYGPKGQMKVAYPGDVVELSEEDAKIAAHALVGVEEKLEKEEKKEGKK